MPRTRGTSPREEGCTGRTPQRNALAPLGKIISVIFFGPGFLTVFETVLLRRKVHKDDSANFTFSHYLVLRQRTSDIKRNLDQNLSIVHDLLLKA